MDIRLSLPDVQLEGELLIPDGAESVVIFAHGSGSSRHSSRNKYVADRILEDGIGTLLFDLLTEEEDQTYENRFDIPLITERLVAVTDYLLQQPATRHLYYGYFGASTGAAAALGAAARQGKSIRAVVSRGGRPDLAMKDLPQVEAATLLIVGSLDTEVLQLNRQAYDALRGEKRLDIIEGATHLFEEPGKLEEAALHATRWFKKHLHAPADEHPITDRHV